MSNTLNTRPVNYGISIRFELDGDDGREFFDESFTDSDERAKYIHSYYNNDEEYFRKLQRDISRLEYLRRGDIFVSEEVIFQTTLFLSSDTLDDYLSETAILKQLLKNLSFTDISQHINWTRVQCDIREDLYEPNSPLLPDSIHSLFESFDNSGDYNDDNSDNEEED